VLRIDIWFFIIDAYYWLIRYRQQLFYNLTDIPSIIYASSSSLSRMCHYNLAAAQIIRDNRNINDARHKGDIFRPLSLTSRK